MRAATPRPSRTPAATGRRRLHAQMPALASATPNRSGDSIAVISSTGLSATCAAFVACSGRDAAVR